MGVIINAFNFFKCLINFLFNFQVKLESVDQRHILSINLFHRYLYSSEVGIDLLMCGVGLVLMWCKIC